ncbi:unnamed protein product [Schistosoma margrebowiei]|uniref:Uncharacterized protein n=1 Tax=Schistosoma margrebowiei TaxID=48269 RepID=A0A3P8EWF6_9TREM|nr:unnamed protein product [Schistosoma margrebowiei]
MPAELVQATSQESFKRQLDLFLRTKDSIIPISFPLLLLTYLGSCLEDLVTPATRHGSLLSESFFYSVNNHLTHLNLLRPFG